MSNFISLIYQHGMIAMFIIILLEYACFPVSSEVVLPFCGAAASIQHVDFFLILPVSVLAGILGTTICYSIGRYGGGSLIDKLVKKFPGTEKGIQTSYQRFDKYGALAVCFLRVIPLCRTYVAFIAGAAKQSYLTFVSSSLIGISVWNAILIGFGYLFRENWNIVEDYYSRYKNILFPVIFIGAIGFLIYLLYNKNKKKKLEE